MILYAIHCRPRHWAPSKLGHYAEDLISNPDTYWMDYNDKHKMGFHMCRIWYVKELNEVLSYCAALNRLCGGQHEVIEIVEPV